MALQLVTCLSDEQAQDLRAQILDRIRFDPQLSETFPDPDVLFTCLNGMERIGIWRNRNTSDVVRQRGLSQINMVPPFGETFTLKVSSGMIRTEAYKKMPGFIDNLRRFNLNVQNFGIDFVSPDRVSTWIFGIVETIIPLPFTSPPYHFKFVVTDTFRNPEEGVQCFSENHSEIDNDLALILSGLGSSLLMEPIGGLAPFAIQRGVEGSVNVVGAGCVALMMVNRFNSFMTKGGWRVNLVYREAHVDYNGIRFSGQIMRVHRQPRVTIMGPDVWETTSATLTLHYTLHTEDLRGALTTMWSSSGGEILNPSPWSVDLVFDLSNASPGQAIRRSIFAHVTDEDMLVAEDHFSVVVFKRHGHDPCMHNRNLPGCEDWSDPRF